MLHISIKRDSDAYATSRQDTDTGTGEGGQELWGPVDYQRSGEPDLDMRISRFEGFSILLGPSWPSRTHSSATTTFKSLRG